jgi:hypothetical protein
VLKRPTPNPLAFHAHNDGKVHLHCTLSPGRAVKRAKRHDLLYYNVLQDSESLLQRDWGCLTMSKEARSIQFVGTMAFPVRYAWVGQAEYFRLLANQEVRCQREKETVLFLPLLEEKAVLVIMEAHRFKEAASPSPGPALAKALSYL